MLTAQAVREAARDSQIAPFSFVLRRLDAPGSEIAIDPERPFYPASMLKTPLALALLTLVRDGVLTLNQRVSVTQDNMTTNDKESPLVPGYDATLDELLELMITISDNVATNVLFDLAGRERATGIVRREYGLEHTGFFRKLSGSEPLIVDPAWDRVTRNAHSAGDAARVFELIARSLVPFASLLRGMLSRQQWKNKLPAGLHAGDRFDHKTGDTDEVTHDGGILETEQGASYVLVLYTGMPSSDENNAKFGSFMRAIRGELSWV